jgi:hypothetical protein
MWCSTRHARASCPTMSVSADPALLAAIMLHSRLPMKVDAPLAPLDLCMKDTRNLLETLLVQKSNAYPYTGIQVVNWLGPSTYMRGHTWNLPNAETSSMGLVGCMKAKAPLGGFHQMHP